MSTSIIRRTLTVRDRKFKVAIIGAKCVGKSALTVRIKTRKFIHNYAPNTESKCTFTAVVDGETVNMDVIDTAALQTAENAKLEERIKWADAFILLYSVTDQSSLTALVAAKFLINLYAKRRRVTASGNHVPDLVALVGNKCDMEHERMISEEDGRLAAEMNDCTHFFELSARESYECVKMVFDSLYRSYLIKPLKHSSSTLPRITTLPMKIPDDQAEQARIHAAKRKERSTTAITIPSNNDTTCRVSPVTFKKIIDDSSIYSSSPDDCRDDIHFVGEQIIDSSTDSSSSSQRRITVCGSHSPALPRIAGSHSPALPRKVSKSRVKSKQRKSTGNGHEYNFGSGEQRDSNNNK